MDDDLFPKTTTMNIHSPFGTMVRYLNRNGYDKEREHANQYLKEDEIYTVLQTDVGGWSSTVTLLEFPLRRFNTVMFEEVTERGEAK